MKIAIGNDHRGYSAKCRLVSWLSTEGHEIIDLGATNANDPTDYPDYAIPVAEMVARNEVWRGILICGTGIGMCIAANKVGGARAATCHDPLTAEISRRHNNSNILCMSADLLSEELMDRLVQTWLSSEFDGGRHARRIDKISQFEDNRSALS